MTNSLEARRRQLFATYVARLLQRRSVNTLYTPQQTIHWLAWLAKQLVQHNQVEFYLEGMQPDWLPAGRLRQIYQFVAVRLSAGVIGGLISLFVYGLFFSLSSSLMYGLIGML